MGEISLISRKFNDCISLDIPLFRVIIENVSGYKMGGAKLNIYDVAREAGVSIATVSRVLNEKGNVSDKSMQKVNDALKKLNYSPSLLARALTVKSTHTVGVLTIDIRDPYYAGIAYTIEQEFYRRGYNMMLCNTGGDEDKKIEYLNALAQKQADGVIIVGSSFGGGKADDFLKEYARKIPVVYINGYGEMEDVYFVICDDRRGIELMCEHLLSQGKKRLHYIQDDTTFSAFQKRQGFLNALKRHGMEAGEDSITVTEMGIHSGYEAAGRIFQHPCDAVVCGEDITAAGVLNYINEHSIPAVVTGFNNSYLCEALSPPLSSVDNRVCEVAQNAVKVLDALLSGEEAAAKTIITPRLVLR